MLLTCLISRWFKKWFRPTRTIRKQATLKLDTLEGREVPATFTVTNLLDSGAAGSLRWAIEQSNASTASPNTINIANSAIGQLNLKSSLPLITQAVTIDNISGGSFTISGGKKFQILATNAPITLDKINLAQGAGLNGGAIDVTKSASVALNTCNVTMCVASGDGGGLYSSGGNVTIGHTTFSSDTANQSGGAIFVHGNINAIFSAVTSNKAKISGGGIYAASGTVQIEESTVIGNNAAMANGGGIWAAGNVVVEGSRTVGPNKVAHTNLAKVSGNFSFLNGGGIFSAQGSITLTEAYLKADEAKTNYGGGVYEGNGTVNVNSGVQIIGDYALKGGGIYLGTGNITVAASAEINSNRAWGGGGIFDGMGDVNIAGEVNGNIAAYGNGGGIWANGNVTLDGNHTNPARVSANSAYMNGGGIYNVLGNVSVTFGRINSNDALHDEGGGIYDANGNVSINASAQVNSNQATGGNGGGIYVVAGNVTVAASGEVVGDAAYSNGGGIYDGKGNVNIAGQVSGNFAYYGSGGGIYAGLGTVNVLKGGKVCSNLANEFRHIQTIGGGETSSGFTGTSGFVGATGETGGASGFSGAGGGATGGTGGGVTGGGGTGGVPTGGGGTGGVPTGGGGTGGVGTGGVPTGGGGAPTGGDPTGGGGATGGAISDLRAFKPNLSAVNGVIAGGGGIYVVQGTVNVSGGQVNGNATDYGGGAGICNLAGTVNLTGGTQVDSNYAKAAGGGVYDNTAANTMGVQITDATVAGNIAGVDGGGVFVHTGSISVLDSTISSNDATRRHGGGLDDKDKSGKVTVTDSTIGGNLSALTGSGIDSDGTAIINNSTIAHNNILNPNAAGAGIFARGAIDINNTIVAGNVNEGNGTPEDIRGKASGKNNVINDASSAGGLVNGVNGNIIGLGGTGTRPVNTIIATTLTNTGGVTKTYSLAPSSVALEAGDNALNPAAVGPSDQRGLPRTVNGLMDIGAVEDS